MFRRGLIEESQGEHTAEAADGGEPTSHGVKSTQADRHEQV
jgi:hypothetical protein